MKIGKIILDCIYPRRCPLCHEVIMPKGSLICRTCQPDLHVLGEPRCKRCSKPLPDSEDEYCYDCSHINHAFTQGYSILPYDGRMQQSMIYFKFHGRQEYGEFYGKMLLHLAAGTIRRWQPQVFIPVPLHPKKQKNRGYNQAAIIARVLSEGLSIAIRTDLVKRIKNTKAQKELNNKSRRQNLQNAFAAMPAVGSYQRVVLVDDIYTTGSTVDAVAVELKKQGVKEVFFLSVCIGSGL